MAVKSRTVSKKTKGGASGRGARGAARSGAATTPVKKVYLKRKNLCKVTFRLPKTAAPEAKQVCVVGEFNDWNIYANPMKRLKSGEFTLTLDLMPGREYQYRYLIDDVQWENDWNADRYVRSPYGDSDNSVITV